VIAGYARIYGYTRRPGKTWNRIEVDITKGGSITAFDTELKTKIHA
jgi:hypothetical protein